MTPQDFRPLKKRNSKRTNLMTTLRKSLTSNPNPPNEEINQQEANMHAITQALSRLEQDFSDHKESTDPSSVLSQNESLSKSSQRLTTVMNRTKFNSIPQVSRSDIIIGEYLGRGSFCDVFEVEWIVPDQEGTRTKGYRGRSMSANIEKLKTFSLHSAQTTDCTLASTENNHSSTEIHNQGCHEEYLNLAFSNDLIFKLEQTMDYSKTATDRTARRSYSQIYTDYFSNSAQHNYSTSSKISTNSNKFALKCLRSKVLSEQRNFIVGAEDLARETAILACLDHPNIIKLHARAHGSFAAMFQFDSSTSSSQREQVPIRRNSAYQSDESINDGYFIIVDKLSSTLTERIEEWDRNVRALENDAHMRRMNEDPSSPPITKNNPYDHLYQRLTVAYAIVNAVEYLHSCNVVFRDLKPDNVGFDHFDCVKLFDFGFATIIPPLWKDQASSKPKSQGYGPLKEKCGTTRYMAPEVALSLGYSKEVDVYSFGMLLWEICAMEKPFHTIHGSKAYYDLVVVSGSRPPLNKDPLWTKSLRSLMMKCWSSNPIERPTMVQVKIMLCEILREINVQLMKTDLEDQTNHT